MSDRENILEKIRKCMAMASSATGNEAETALRQARKLMEMHQVKGIGAGSVPLMLEG